MFNDLYSYISNINFLETIYLTIKLSFITTVILIPIGLLLGYYLSVRSNYFKLVLETLTWMPLTLPPTVLGFYLLVIFSPINSLGKFLQRFDFSFAFTFQGLVLGSVIFSLPFMVNPIKNALRDLPPFYKEVSFIYGKSRIYTFFRVLMPNILPSIMLGITTSFAHTLGEFGVVAMIGGDRQGVTRVASIALFNEWELANYTGAHAYAIILFSISFLLLLVVIILSKKFSKNTEDTL